MSNQRSGNDVLKQQTGLVQKPQSAQDIISGMIRAEMPRIQRLIQNPSMTTRFAQLAMMELRRNPKLFECAPQSVLACLMTSASLGLQLGVGGQAYLIPYRSECTFVPGWKGLVALMHRTKAADVWTDVVREGDYFTAQFGSEPRIDHEKRAGRDAKITHFYAVGKVRGADYPVIDVWSVDDITAHRNRFNKVGDKHYSYSNPESFEAYGRKIPLLQVLKYLPVSFEMEQAMELDSSAEAGKQAIRPNDVIADAMAPQLPAPSTPFDDEFGFLGWGPEKRAEFLDGMKDKSEDEIRAALEAELDK